jgi:hypothetical protein
LVAITPSCGTVSTLGAAVVGLLAGIVCSFAVGLKFRFGYDDSLDVVGVHFFGGLVGVLLIGFLATEVMTAGPNGLFYGGGFVQLGKQALPAVVVGVSRESNRHSGRRRHSGTCVDDGRACAGRRPRLGSGGKRQRHLAEHRLPRQH